LATNVVFIGRKGWTRLSWTSSWIF